MKIEKIPLYLLLIFLLLSSFACSSKKGGSSKATLQFFTSHLSSDAIALYGGIMVYGRSTETAETFGFYVYQGHEDVNLSKGIWEFWAIGWRGPHAMSGEVLCGSTSADLKQDSATVDLVLSTAGCTDPVFGPNNFLSGDQFKELNLITCLDLHSIIDGTANCSGNVGDAGSYRIFMGQYFSGESLNYNGDIGGLLESNCIPDSASGDGITVTDLRLPVGGIKPNLFSTVVEVFSDSACINYIRSHPFLSGISGASDNLSENLLFDSSYETMLYLLGSSGSSIGINTISSGFIIIPGGSYEISTTATGYKMKAHVGEERKQMNSSSYKFFVGRVPKVRGNSF